MRRCLLGFSLVGLLGAQAPLHIVSVERRGLPPYEATDRIYGLDGGLPQGLHVGDRLRVKRAGDYQFIGRLWITELRGEQSAARFEPVGTSFPMKGDLVFPEVLLWPPAVRPVNQDPLALVQAPLATAEAPPREGIIYFLPQQTEVSPAGVRKLEGWVKAWGASGRWSVQVPSTKALSASLLKQRTESLQAALRALGIQQVGVETEARTLESKFDPTWIRHWD
ncbi:hypothetical protein [Geothrix sp. PMB-07]|uniref:hypothetical protein n=1 Tax=Geothrix sp. PMB-07 TaxID=3068640 RepID=UPI002741E414|nr:hypothetical protein [Geothrix sp. PMB-07]WLT31820.1 hypothetical protein Q9293_00520 [Geothrix sp. PMB-07]